MKKIIILTFLFSPILAFAAANDLGGLIDIIEDLINQAIPVLIAASVLFFLWGVAKYFFYADNESKRAESRQYMTWGIIALFVIVSIWPLVGLIYNTIFGGSTGSSYNSYYTAYVDFSENKLL